MTGEHRVGLVKPTGGDGIHFVQHLHEDGVLAK
jgi:hypothetical protein